MSDTNKHYKVGSEIKVPFLRRGVMCFGYLTMDARDVAVANVAYTAGLADNERIRIGIEPKSFDPKEIVEAINSVAKGNRRNK